MTIEQIIELLKLKLGIMSDVQDARLAHLVQAVIDELVDEKGIRLDMDEPRHVSFITDYAEYRYKNVGEEMPRYLLHRLHNLFIKDGQR